MQYLNLEEQAASHVEVTMVVSLLYNEKGRLLSHMCSSLQKCLSHCAFPATGALCGIQLHIYRLLPTTLESPHLRFLHDVGTE